MGGCGSAGTERVVVGGSRVGMKWGSSFMLGHDGNLGWVSVGVGNGGCGVGDERARRGCGEKLGSERRDGGRECNECGEGRDSFGVLCGLHVLCGCGCGKVGALVFVLELSWSEFNRLMGVGVGTGGELESGQVGSTEVWAKQSGDFVMSNKLMFFVWKL